MDTQNNNLYTPHYFFRNKHFNTIFRTVFHQTQINYRRKRLKTKDNDFLDLDFSMVNSSRIAIVIHGLEGSSNSNYIKSLTKVLNSNDMDVVAVNLRGCSGEPNKLLHSYHSGKTDDLEAVVSFIENQYSYKEINLVGFSLGGNIILKYLGECKYIIPAILSTAVTVSVPCDLKGSSEELAKIENFFYIRRFLRTLKIKAQAKLKQFPQAPQISETIKTAKNFYDFDNLFTAPIHGFIDANDYWNKCSSKQFIPNINIPSLLITSMDDPFLSESCIPCKEASENEFFTLEVSKYGGHVGFNTNFNVNNGLWLENRILNFLQYQM